MGSRAARQSSKVFSARRSRVAHARGVTAKKQKPIKIVVAPSLRLPLDFAGGDEARRVSFAVEATDSVVRFLPRAAFRHSRDRIIDRHKAKKKRIVVKGAPARYLIRCEWPLWGAPRPAPRRSAIKIFDF